MRMQMGAERMCMPAPSVDQFVDAVKQIALSNRRWVIFFFPYFSHCFLKIYSLYLFYSLYNLFFEILQVPPPGKGALYVRPLLIGSGPILGFAPAPEYTFLIYASPVGNYFKVNFPPLISS